MRPLLLPHMPGAPFGDPALCVEILWERRALLFDLGDLGGLPPKKLLKVSHAFVSHTHIDHFIGFDALLRLMLNREQVLAVFGPPGFLANVQGKLEGYTWNLTADYPFSIRAAEVHPEEVRSRIFPCREGFSPGPVERSPFDGRLVDEGQIRITAARLDHLIPSLAFAVQERFHINVRKNLLSESGWAVGPWLKDMKQALWSGEGEDRLLTVPRREKEEGTREVPIRDLKPFLAFAPGQKIAYVADCRFTPENAGRIIELADGADQFFCEAAFLDRDRERAAERAHLTARQAGELARSAGVKSLTVFHFSPRYETEAELLYREAQEAFGGQY